MKRTFLAAVLSLFISNAFAANAVVTWTAPTKNVDGTSIPASGAGSIASYKVEYGSCTGSGTSTAFGVKAGEVTVAAPALTLTVPGLSVAQTYCFRAYASNTYAQWSDASNVAWKLIPAPVPEAPVLGATITLAYELVPSAWDGVRLGRVVGTVAIGTVCDGEAIQTQKGEFHMVNSDDVRFTKQPKSNVIVTRCEAA